MSGSLKAESKEKSALFWENNITEWSFIMKNTIMDRALKGEFVLIAECGVNYYDIAKEKGITPMEAAKLMVLEARRAGIHAVKFQTYKAGTLAAKDSPYYWDINEEPTRSQYELFQKFDSFGAAEYRELADYCEEIGIEFLSTAFDFESADYLDSMMNIYKVSSSDISNLPFVAYQAKKNKTIMLSVGASNADEIDRAVEVIRKYNDKPLILMHCVLEYPTPYEHANLNKIVSLKERYKDVIIGYSDHTKPDSGFVVVQAAYLKGAQIIEKHYTLNKTLKGNDHYHAMDPGDAEKIIEKIAYLDKICGTYELKCLESEQKSRRNARRSVVALGDIPKGAVITESMLTYKRPGTGISPSRVNEIIGKTALTDIADDTIITEEMFA